MYDLIMSKTPEEKAMESLKKFLPDEEKLQEIGNIIKKVNAIAVENQKKVERVTSPTVTKDFLIPQKVSQSQEMREIIRQELGSSKTPEKQIEIFINRSGGVSLDRNDYPFILSESYVQILKFLFQKGSFTSLEEILDNSTYSSIESLHKVKKKINDLLRHNLNLDDDVIDSFRTRGYRINPRYKIHSIK